MRHRLRKERQQMGQDLRVARQISTLHVTCPRSLRSDYRINDLKMDSCLNRENPPSTPRNRGQLPMCTNCRAICEQFPGQSEVDSSGITLLSTKSRSVQDRVASGRHAGLEESPSAAPK